MSIRIGPIQWNTTLFLSIKYVSIITCPTHANAHCSKEALYPILRISLKGNTFTSCSSDTCCLNKCWVFYFKRRRLVTGIVKGLLRAERKTLCVQRRSPERRGYQSSFCLDRGYLQIPCARASQQCWIQFVGHRARWDLICITSM